MGEREQREFADRMLGPEWEEGLKTRLGSGLVSPTIEAKLMDYKFGKPVERTEVIVRGAFGALSLEELSARARRLSLLLDKLAERKRADNGRLLEAGEIVEAEVVEEAAS